eukprot:CAMPEP_0178392828 /NCGR_PEP_ID=MMETSP0689_2-20121128/11878_1 /TAXON_ID=160604 /ORGANISM="Amphidinium massartii, Strain CS-259" /LENGTH=181 /DNA_ID=CAMNT_0020013411 /DNA_START=173 /DNA_END=720 /DNA_ORIENTATION=-
MPALQVYIVAPSVMQVGTPCLQGLTRKLVWECHHRSLQVLKLRMAPSSLFGLHTPHGHDLRQEQPMQAEQADARIPDPSVPRRQEHRACNWSTASLHARRTSSNSLEWVLAAMPSTDAPTCAMAEAALTGAFALRQGCVCAPSTPQGNVSPAPATLNKLSAQPCLALQVQVALLYSCSAAA